jgi:hypothetical protein
VFAAEDFVVRQCGKTAGMLSPFKALPHRMAAKDRCQTLISGFMEY